MYFESDTVKSDCPVQIFRKMIKYLRWYRTHQHMSKKLQSFDMLKNSSKIIYFYKNNRTLPCFLKSY